ncbi:MULTISPECIES: hypothetical protein [Protofrankia]|uniref:Uncharacterized protein n=1 Tax=Protofrankia coriariae TaxID=1562887 RepID=A0ABR5F195_9ACTN|nr:MULTISPECIES: hypothetical protein [Protofrankia]KLL10484.1 hypothetical protein FrCorBMG51_17550 [Protofrankia coriariae]ONH34118.1 hypothetical protein BL254_18220 [Protofrankia sp. BMG5.30]
MRSNVIRPTREELEERRRVILERIGLTAEELRARRDAYDLAGDEFATVIELEEIDFLLGA